MSNQETIDILEKFEDFLSIGNVFMDGMRTVGWVVIKGLSILVDGMENVIDTILLTKQFFQNPEVVSFIDSIRPLLWVLLALSLIITGYMLIFQRKLDAETIGINLIVSISVLVLMFSGMERVNQFTDEAIRAINNGSLYSVDNGTISENIISRNITDLVEFDKNNWENPEKIQSLPLSIVRNIKITEKLKHEELNLQHPEVAQHYLTWKNGSVELAELEQDGENGWNEEYYYRFSVDWLTIVITLGALGFTLFAIAYKLARLSFELVFNQLLATIIAPVDIHDGQKTKKILQNILGIFIVVILIFLSMKLYMIGTVWLENNLDGWAYLIALIGFSVAVIDCPNIVERLFGIDAGLRNGWGLAVGAYATEKFGNGLAKAIKGKLSAEHTLEDINQGQSKNQRIETEHVIGNQSPLSKLQPKSPFESNVNQSLAGHLAGSGMKAVSQTGTEAQDINLAIGKNRQGHLNAASSPYSEDLSVNNKGQQTSTQNDQNHQTKKHSIDFSNGFADENESLAYETNRHSQENGNDQRKYIIKSQSAEERLKRIKKREKVKS